METSRNNEVRAKRVIDIMTRRATRVYGTMKGRAMRVYGTVKGSAMRLYGISNRDCRKRILRVVFRGVRAKLCYVQCLQFCLFDAIEVSYQYANCVQVS